MESTRAGAFSMTTAISPDHAISHNLGSPPSMVGGILGDPGQVSSAELHSRLPPGQVHTVIDIHS